MKITNIKNITKFFETVDSCVGKVELISVEGDRLNLKSKLTQYISLAKVFSDETIQQLELIAYEAEDEEKLFAFIEEEKE